MEATATGSCSRRNQQTSCVIGFFDSIEHNDYIAFMSATLTIRKLDAEVKRKLRLRAAIHQRSMEAEVREILTRAVLETDMTNRSTESGDTSRRFDGLVGRWHGRGNTDEIMTELRGDE